MEIPKPHPHPLKQKVEDRRLTLWQLRMMVDNAYSEPRLSRFLNGIEAMPEWLETKIKDVVK